MTAEKENLVKKSLAIVFITFIIVSFTTFLEPASAKKIWKTYTGIITSVRYQEVLTGKSGYGTKEPKTIITMKDKQLIFSGTYTGEIPLNTKIIIEVKHPDIIADIKKIEK